MAAFYDRLERSGENSRLKQWRTLLWSKVQGTNILEIGVGTGANLPYYPPGATVIAVDISERMLKRARDKARQLNLKVNLEEMDVQDLHLADGTFDTVVASLVFCSVPDPVRGLREIGRVCKPGGKVVLLEHVLSSGRVRRFLMNLVNPVIFWMIGDNINRKTVENVTTSGLIIEKVTDLGDIFKLIEARKKAAALFPSH